MSSLVVTDPSNPIGFESTTTTQVSRLMFYHSPAVGGRGILLDIQSQGPI